MQQKINLHLAPKKNLTFLTLLTNYNNLQMENDIQRLERIKFMHNGFDRIKNEEIELYFNQKFSTWIYRQSDTKEKLNDDKYLSFDKEGKLIGCSYSGTKDGFELTEKDFVEIELMLLDKVKYDLLNLKNRKQFTFYKEYLNKRNSGIILKGDFPIPFISRYAYELFLRLVAKFGNFKNGNLANYSYVYERMVKAGYIDNDAIKQKSFRDRLSENGIEIDKIKSFREIGFKNQKNDIYEEIKGTFKIV